MKISYFYFLSLLIIGNLLTSMYAMEGNEFSRIKNRINDSLQAEVISPAVWRDIARDIKQVEQKGTASQQAAINTIIQENKPIVEQTMINTIRSTLANSEVTKAAAAIAMGTVYGALPSIGFKALSILAGNLDLATASTQLIDVGILSTLDSFVRYAEEKGKTSPELAAFQVGAFTTALHQFLTYTGPRPTHMPLLGPSTKPLMSGLQGMAISILKKRFTKTINVSDYLQKINWKDVAQGPSNQSAITQHSSAYTFIKDNLAMILQNETVRAAVATTVTYAVEGALVGAVMHSLGLGFYDESLPMALTNSMMRGALEGLYNFSQHGEQQLGVVQRLKGGFVSTTVQRYMQTGMGMGALDITPVVVQQVTSGAVTSIIRQAGGWGNTFKALYSKGKQVLFGK